jgi:hypothetical protein
MTQQPTETKSKETRREEEHERRISQGRLSFLSTRNVDMRVEHFLPSRTQH